MPLPLAAIEEDLLSLKAGSPHGALLPGPLSPAPYATGQQPFSAPVEGLVDLLLVAEDGNGCLARALTEGVLGQISLAEASSSPLVVYALAPLVFGTGGGLCLGQHRCSGGRQRQGPILGDCGQPYGGQRPWPHPGEPGYCLPASE